MSTPLWVVMPVFNEEASVARVVEEWLGPLRALGVPFVFCALNDGSTDGTETILANLAAEQTELRTAGHPNRGHGQTCLRGYRLALDGGAEWVLQIDSDGQCDPRFLPALWAARHQRAAVYGYRARREDGRLRRVGSRAVSLAVLAATGTWVRDANVPYRLMRADVLAETVEQIPAEFDLANIMLAVLQQRACGIRWVDITFRDRFGGTPNVNTVGLGKKGLALFRQLRRATGQPR